MEISSVVSAVDAQVKILYVRNLMLSTSEDTLENIFNQAAGHSNAVERVKKIKDYAFVHFHDRDDALRSLNVINSMSLVFLTVSFHHHVASR